MPVLSLKLDGFAGSVVKIIYVFHHKDPKTSFSLTHENLDEST